jgi:hypothetical protein
MIQRALDFVFVLLILFLRVESADKCFVLRGGCSELVQSVCDVWDKALNELHLPVLAHVFDHLLGLHLQLLPPVILGHYLGFLEGVV